MRYLIPVLNTVFHTPADGCLIYYQLVPGLCLLSPVADTLATAAGTYSLQEQVPVLCADAGASGLFILTLSSVFGVAWSTCPL